MVVPDRGADDDEARDHHWRRTRGVLAVDDLSEPFAQRYFASAAEPAAGLARVRIDREEPRVHGRGEDSRFAQRVAGRLGVTPTRDTPRSELGVAALVEAARETPAFLTRRGVEGQDPAERRRN